MMTMTIMMTMSMMTIMMTIMRIMMIMRMMITATFFCAPRLDWTGLDLGSLLISLMQSFNFQENLILPKNLTLDPL